MRLRGISGFASNLVDLVSGHFTGWLIIIMMCLVMAEVISRYISRHPLMVADEFSGYLMAAISCLGLAYTWREKSHLRIRVLVERLPTRVANWIRLITLIILCGFVPVIIKALYDLTAYSAETDSRSFTTLRTPLMWPQMVMVIGFVIFYILILVEAIEAIRAIRSGRAAKV